MSKFFGLVLLAIAMAVSLYLLSDSGNFLKFKFNLPIEMPVVTTPHDNSEYKFSGNQQSIETASAPVTVSSIRPQTPYGYGELVLFADWNIGDAGADIAGWKIKTLGNEFAIPGAQEVYTFGGSLNSLRIRQGDEARLFSGSSPKGNFRMNKCIGYLSVSADFIPPIEKNCPDFSSEEIQHLSNACRRYISSLSACETPKPSMVSFDDVTCHEFLNTINYEGCVSRHRSDSDFLDREIRVWIGDNLKYFSPEGGVIDIYDKADKFISQYRY